MTTKTLISWLGNNDLKAAGVLPQDMDDESVGPIAEALENIPFDELHLLCDQPEASINGYVSWLSKRFDIRVQVHPCSLRSPVDFGDIYLALNSCLTQLTQSKNSQELSIHLSPGTPSMTAVSILLGKTKYNTKFVQSFRKSGAQFIEIPFELSAEYIPAAKSLDGKQISQLAEASAPIDAAFDNIVTRNPHMKKLKAQAQILAERDVPVLIYGETGTGKELFARAIHNASSRSDKPFIPLNCGAIPAELVDSVLFGHKKGAFTGATSDRPGVFEQANGGTLFLDEFGELEPHVQVRLLRVLQERCFVPVGGTNEQRVDVRLITATHRNLMEAVAEGSFREDLFYRVAVGVLHLPALREREGDLTLLSDQLMRTMSKSDPTLENKIISPEAKNIINRHSWRGNVRELQSTILRAALWCQGNTITAEDIRQALFKMPEKELNVLGRDVSQGIDIQEIMGDVAVEYIRQALEVSSQNKTRAAQLLGLKNYQTLNNWMEKYGIS
ncbi:AAA family ATPase [Oleiphilus sp. HI0071]|uniref:sigma-54 interaction domain-containing protein n=1 Tax=Oleiphilus sp. HI0080 TaxID=1822255 RepID=UPI0007C3A49F|nr:sigma 54-interacting transcriptional regulator [Oleiphilus sp. HI0080]KZY60178.1 AAA family ATPase [Oleiphilus sp. HI0065]KZY82491.1 AAA family ATPase [Oleiphilus sp. HI0071]KZY90147.1 AAA family ATPase [Oleiphilus sp. HI0073]KZZ49664.1 AAA family ATPase [Oleiphilus sp. HI0122]KZZ15134.1 AAA family ATPase [Oleiphilus sp. HI0080]